MSCIKVRYNFVTEKLTFSYLSALIDNETFLLFMGVPHVFGHDHAGSVYAIDGSRIR